MMRIVFSLLAVALFGAACAQDARLLTENGLTNPEFSQYEGLERPLTGGWAEANPPFNGGQETARASFAEGPLTNGDISTNHGRTPFPYAYWQGQQRAELTVSLNGVYDIERARIWMLFPETGPHGASAIDVYLKGDPLEFPDVLKVGTISPITNGWNEIGISRRADGLRFVFHAVPGRAYITLSEIEVWGTPVAGAAPYSVSVSDPKRTEDGITWWAFDFGPAGSPSFAQFCVVDSKTVYSREKGYGWIPYEGGEPLVESNFGPASASVPGLGERDRGGAGSDALFRDFVMTSEYYHTQVRQTFAVDVPDGAYRILSMHGDTEYGRRGVQPYWVEAEGERVAENLKLPWSRTTDAVFDATVTDGRLDITLDAEHENPANRGFVLNGLAILPANTDEERQFADAKIERIRAAVIREHQEAFDREFTEVPYVESATMVEPSAEDTARGFIAWAPNWMRLIYPNTVPTAEDVTRELSLVAAPGEFEPCTIAVRALEKIKGLVASVGEFAGDAGTIPASAVEIRRVKCWPQRLGSSWSKEYQTMPELLLAESAANLDADTTGQFWFTVHVPEDAAPGTYIAPVRLSSPDGATWETQMRLRVLPFALTKAERPVGMYWRSEQWDRERLDSQIRDMLAHGVTTVTLDNSVPVKNVDGKVVVETGGLLELLQHLKALGVEGPIPFFGGLDGAVKRAFPGGDFEANFVEAVRQIQEVSAREDTPQLLFYPVDEIGNDEERGQKAHELCSLIAQVPGATSYVTVNNYAAGEKWGDSFDIWCGNIEYTSEQETKLLARGKRYMRYGPAYLSSCRKARNSSGFGFYRRPAEAHYYWHYQCFNADPFNDLDGTARDWCAAYPGENEEIPTLDWESIREGIDDMRYIATLKEFAARAAQGNARQKAASDRALATLAEILTSEEGVNQYDFGAALSDDEFSALRGRLIEHILELQAALE